MDETCPFSFLLTSETKDILSNSSSSVLYKSSISIDPSSCNFSHKETSGLIGVLLLQSVIIPSKRLLLLAICCELGKYSDGIAI